MSHLRNKIFALITLVIMLSLVLSACSGKQPQKSSNATEQPQGQSDDKTLVMLVNSPTDHIDPDIGASVPHTRLLTAMYEALLTFKPETTELTPALATSWQSNGDKSEYTVKLRDGVKFHDGTTMDAESVKVSFERSQKIGKGESYLIKDVEKVEAVDPKTVRFKLKKSSPEFPFALTRIFIVSPKAIKDNEKNGDLAQAWFSRHEAGTGPYKLAEWVENQKYVLDKFPDYWQGWQGNHVEKLVFRIVVENATQRLLLERGEADYAENIVYEDLKELSKNPNIKIERRVAPKPFYISFNTERKPLNDPRVRQAISLAFDYDGVIQQAMLGYATPMQGPVPTSYPGHLKSLPAGKQDLDKAKKLLAEAGYPKGGFKLRYMFLEHWLFEKTVGLLLQSTLKELGIDLVIEPQPWATMVAKMKDPNERPDLVMYAQTTPTPSPLTILYPMFYSKSDHWSHFTYKNPEVDSLLDKVSGVLDDGQRARVYEQIQEKIYNDYPQIYVFSQDEVSVFRSNVKGYALQPTWARMLNYYGLYKEKASK